MLECLFCFALSPLFAGYTGDIDGDFGIHVAMGDPIYLWGSYERPEYRIVGQDMNRLQIPGVGIGYRAGDGKWKVSFEAGYFYPSVDPDENIKDEIVGVALVGSFGSPGWKPDHYAYSVRKALGGRVAASYEVSDTVDVFVAARKLSIRQRFSFCTGDDPVCEYPVETGQHWLMFRNLPATSIQLGFTINLGGR
jgi:hypothetical protein